MDMNRIRGGLSIARLIDLILAAFIALVAATAAIDVILPLAGHPVIIIAGSSMAPAVQMGSIVVEERPDAADAAAPAPGDVASFRLASGTTVTHRVTRVVERDDGIWYEIKGDANAEPDPTLLPSQALVGRVLGSIPYLGYLLWLLHLPTGILAVVSATLALCVARLLVDPEEEEESAPDLGVAEGPYGLPV
jgi:signal peptidase